MKRVKRLVRPEKTRLYKNNHLDMDMYWEVAAALEVTASRDSWFDEIARQEVAYEIKETLEDSHEKR